MVLVPLHTDVESHVVCDNWAVGVVEFRDLLDAGLVIGVNLFDGDADLGFSVGTESSS